MVYRKIFNQVSRTVKSLMARRLALALPVIAMVTNISGAQAAVNTAQLSQSVVGNTVAAKHPRGTLSVGRVGGGGELVVRADDDNIGYVIRKDNSGVVKVTRKSSKHDWEAERFLQQPLLVGYPSSPDVKQWTVIFYDRGEQILLGTEKVRNAQAYREVAMRIMQQIVSPTSAHGSVLQTITTLPTSVASTKNMAQPQRPSTAQTDNLLDGFANTPNLSRLNQKQILELSKKVFSAYLDALVPAGQEMKKHEAAEKAKNPRLSDDELRTRSVPYAEKILKDAIYQILPAEFKKEGANSPYAMAAVHTLYSAAHSIVAEQHAELKKDTALQAKLFFMSDTEKQQIMQQRQAVLEGKLADTLAGFRVK